MNNSKISLILLCLALFTLGCNKEEQELQTTYDYSCLIINQGNLSEANGELSLLESNGEIKNQIYQTCNQWALASIIESGIEYKNNWILFCSNEDKIEIIDQQELKLQKSITGIPIPRYGTTTEDILYVTSVEDWTDDSSGKVYKINLKNGEILNKISLGNLPEGILYFENNIWIAADDTIYVLNEKSDQIIKKIPTGMNQLCAKHLITSENGMVWCSLTSHKEDGELILIDGDKMTIVQRNKIPHLSYEGHIVLSPNKENIYYLTSNSTIGAQNADGETKICRWNISTQTSQIVIDGVGFYGFNIHPKTEDIYTANVNGFITNSLFYQYDKNGKIIRNGDLVGVGACRFLFRH